MTENKESADKKENILVRDERKYPLKLNRDYYVVTANDLIRGKQKMNEREAKLLMIAIAQVVKEDKYLKTYTTTITELANFLDTSPNNLYRDIKDICRSLLQRIVEIKTGEGKNDWCIFHWVSAARFENGKLTIRLSDEIKPFLIDLADHYTQYQLDSILSFSSYYSTRLYQIIRCDEGESFGTKEDWKFNCDELRELFQTGKKYTRNSDLLKNTVEIAVSEINFLSNIYIFNYQELRSQSKGKPILGISFTAIVFSSKEQKVKYSKKYKSLLPQET